VRRGWEVFEARFVLTRIAITNIVVNMTWNSRDTIWLEGIEQFKFVNMNVIA
jgi:hypothetical protein